MKVDGRTSLTGLLGYPIGYTLSPALHNAAFKALGINWLYIPLRVKPGDLEKALTGMKALDFAGGNVTIPHKEKAASLLDRLEGDSRILGAVNTLVRRNDEWVGYNTDGEGFRAFLEEAGWEVRDSSVFLIGAGGAARAVALTLVRLGARKILVMNRTARRGEELAAWLKRHSTMTEIEERAYGLEGSRSMGECEMVINCTPLGRHDIGELPVDYDRLGRGKLVVDLNYDPPRTAFLEEAARRGAATANGGGMLLYQAAESFRLWTGMEPPLREMRAVLRERNVMER